MRRRTFLSLLPLPVLVPWRAQRPVFKQPLAWDGDAESRSGFWWQPAVEIVGLEHVAWRARKTGDGYELRTRILILALWDSSIAELMKADGCIVRHRVGRYSGLREALFRFRCARPDDGGWTVECTLGRVPEPISVLSGSFEIVDIPIFGRFPA